MHETYEINLLLGGTARETRLDRRQAETLLHERLKKSGLLGRLFG
jgi:hypothetical protein